MIITSYPTSDLSEAGIRGSRYCVNGDKDVSGESATRSGASSECWETCQEARGIVAGIGRGGAAPLGSVSTTGRAPGVAGRLRW